MGHLIVIIFLIILFPLPSYCQPADNQLSALESIFVKRILIEGNTAFSAEALSSITSKYENRHLSFEELQQLREELTLHYVKRGYINSGAILPDQRVVKGIIRFKIIEGRLNDVKITGAKYYREDFFRERILKNLDVPLNINRLQDRLLILQQDPKLKSIQAELSPGLLPGEAILNLNVFEHKPYGWFIQFGNTQTPSLGAYRGDTTVYYDNLLGTGDHLEGSFGLSEGVKDYNVSYSIPLNSYDTTLGLRFRKSYSLVIEYPFENLDIISKTNTISLWLSHPLYKSAQREFRLSLALDLKREETSILGMSYSFSDNSEEGIQKFTVLRFSQDFIDRGQNYVLAYRSCLNLGLNALGASAYPESQKRTFISWLNQFQLIYQLNEEGLQAKLRTALQLSSDTLAPSERFALGGINTLRGYRENLIVRDSGVSSSFELKTPIIFGKDREPLLSFIPFFDSGWAWNKNAETPQPKSLYSIGAGILWQITDKANLQIYYGKALKAIDNKGNNLQDRGIHFVLNTQLL